MMFEGQGASMAMEGLLSFPDFVFEVQPKNFTEEQVNTLGIGGGTSGIIQIGGSVTPFYP